jgi:hypothetical protein
MSKECLNSTARGCTMPAFTFEKLSAPTSHEPAAPPQKQRGALAQLVDRLVQSRTKRNLRQDQSANSPPTKTPE